jgi:hypothetical protein
MIQVNQQCDLQRYAANWALESIEDLAAQNLNDVQDLINICFSRNCDMVFIWTADNTDFIKNYWEGLEQVAQDILKEYGKECLPCIFTQPHAFVNFVIYEVVFSILADLADLDDENDENDEDDENDENDEPETLLNKAIACLKQFLNK